MIIRKIVPARYLETTRDLFLVQVEAWMNLNIRINTLSHSKKILFYIISLTKMYVSSVGRQY